MSAKKKSDFETWFHAQFGPPKVYGGWGKKNVDELIEMVSLGALAKDELHRRMLLESKKDAALKAWCAREAKP